MNGVTSEQLSKLIKSVKSQKRGFEKLAHRALEKLREASEDVHSDDDALPLETKSKAGESSEGAAETKDKKAGKPEVEKSPNATSAKTSVLAISFGFGIVYILAKFLPVDSVIDN